MTMPRKVYTVLRQRAVDGCFDHASSCRIHFNHNANVEQDQAPDQHLMEVFISGHLRKKLIMPKNVGMFDQYIRIVSGFALVAFTFRDGLSIQGWHWAGLIGLVLLLTAFLRSYPRYSALGISSRPARQ
jgi:hypothetical protein